MSDKPRCELCGGDLDIKATMIGCRKCGTVWGRCNGAWVEVKGEYLSPPYVSIVPCSVTGVRAEDNSSPGSAYRGAQRTDECAACGGDPYVQPCPKCKANGHEGDEDERD